MTKSPCLNGRTHEEDSCPYLTKDKNTERCMKCDARVRYAVAQGDLPPEVLEQKEDRVITEALKQKEKEVSTMDDKNTCLEDGCNRKPIKDGRCQRCRAEYIRKEHPEKMRKSKKQGKKVSVIAPEAVAEVITHLDVEPVAEIEKREEEKEEKIKIRKTKICKCGKEPVKARGMGELCYSKWKYRNPDKLKRRKATMEKKRPQINLHFGEKSEAREIINKLQEIARKELRRTTEQALFFIREGIERYEKGIEREEGNK